MREPADPLTEALSRLADGDRAAFEGVYAAARPRVLGLVRRLLAGHPDAEDIAQDALVKVFERASEYDPTVGPALPWILGIATWEARTHRKRRQRSREHATDRPPERPDPVRGPEAALIDAELQRALDATIATLGPTDQEALLAAIERCARPPVAPATFRKRLSRAMSRLKSAWSTQHG